MSGGCPVLISWQWCHYNNITSRRILEVTVGSSRNHQKFNGKTIEFLAIQRTTHHHFWVFWVFPTSRVTCGGRIALTFVFSYLNIWKADSKGDGTPRAHILFIYDNIDPPPHFPFWLREAYKEAYNSFSKTLWWIIGSSGRGFSGTWGSLHQHLTFVASKAARSSSTEKCIPPDVTQNWKFPIELDSHVHLPAIKHRRIEGFQAFLNEVINSAKTMERF